MAFPVIESRNPAADNATGGAATSGSTSAASHSVVLPATVSSGSLLLIVGRVGTTGTVAITGGGWTITQTSDGSVGPDVIFWAYKNTLAAGTEGGTSVTVTHGTMMMAAQTFSITGAEDPATQPPQGAASGTADSTTIDPAPLTPTGGAKDYLWLLVATNEGALMTLAKTPPAGYGADVDVSSGTAGNNWDNVQVHVSTRSLNAASEEPGTITMSSADNWLAYTLAIHPPSGPPWDPEVNSPAILRTSRSMMRLR